MPRAKMREEPSFSLAFPPARIAELAERYVAENAAQALETELIDRVAPAARRRGHLTRDEFVKICAWKTPRSRALVEGNSSAAVEAVTRAAFSPALEPITRAKILRALDGVDWPSASAILHLVFPDEWPLLDYRALESLGVRAPASYTADFVREYVTACQAIAIRAGVTLRALDRALWQFSKEGGGGA